MDVDGYHPATRATGNNARGHKRRVGHSKRSSYEPDEETLAKKKRPAGGDNVRKAAPEESDMMPSLAGASSFFRNQRNGSKGIKVKIQDAVQNGEVLQITTQQYDSFLEVANMADPNRQYVEYLRKQQTQKLRNLVWLLLAGHNTLLYGIGSKQKLIKQLVHDYIAGEDIIEVNAPLPTSTGAAASAAGEQQIVKALLSHIERTVLKNKNIEAGGWSLERRAEIISDLLDVHYGRGSNKAATSQQPSDLPLSPLGSSSGAAAALPGAVHSDQKAQRASRTRVDDSERWGGRYAHAQSRCYIIVHDICGKGLSDATSQRCLAVLAQCSSVALIATMHSLNSVVHWDRRLLVQFGWSYHHVATFERSPIPESDGFPLVVPASATLVNVDAAGEKEQGEEQEEERVDSGVDEAQSEAQSEADANSAVKRKVIAPAAAVKQTSKAGRAQGAGTSGAAAARGTKATNSGATVKSAKSSAAPSAHTTTTAAAAAVTLAERSMQAINSSLTLKHTLLLGALVEALRERTRRAVQEAAAASAAVASGSLRSTRTAVQPVRALSSQRYEPLSHHNGVPFMELFAHLRKTLTVNSVSQLRQILKEYVDHGVVAIVVHQNAEYLCLRPPYDYFKNVDEHGKRIV